MIDSFSIYRGAYRIQSTYLSNSITAALKLAIGILPLAAGRYSLHGIPMFDSLSIIDSKQVVERSMDVVQETFTGRQHKITLR